MATAIGKVLVTGAGGWIGRAVVERLRRADLEVSCISKDKVDVDLVANAATADVVVHCGSGYSNARAEFVDGGLGQAVAVAKGCAKSENAVVFLSSAKVYGWNQDTALSRRSCDETSPCLGADNFSAGKKIVEEILSRAAHQCTILRISNVYGVGIPAKYALGTMMSSALREGCIKLDCTGASDRDFVHFDDVVQVVEVATLRALQSRNGGTKIFNVAAGRLTKLIEVAELVAGATGAKIKTMDRMPVSSPHLSNLKTIDAGYINRFIDPLEGICQLMNQWKEQPWKLT